MIACLDLVQVTAQLWQLAVVHAELPAHLMALKNYFLLAKGDFYHSFLAEVSAAIVYCILLKSLFSLRQDWKWRLSAVLHDSCVVAWERSAFNIDAVHAKSLNAVQSSM